MSDIMDEYIESTQKKQLNDISIQLEKLRKEQNINKSFFSKIARWYSERHFLIKLGIALLSMGMGALVSVLLLFPYPLIGVAIGLLVYLLPSSIFTQHHKTEKKFQHAVSTEILNLEGIMKESMESFQAITMQMKQTLSSLEEKNQEQEKNIQALKTAVLSFQEQVKTSDEILLRLQENQVLCGNNSQLLSNTITRANSTYEHFDINQRELEKINSGLLTTQEKLHHGGQAYEGLSEHVSKSTLSLDKLGNTLEELEKMALENNQVIENHLSELQKSSRYLSTETPEEQNESSAILQERTLANVRQFIASSSLNNRFFPSENKRANNVIAMAQAYQPRQVH